MPLSTAEPATAERERAELQAVLQSSLFVRSPTLAHLLSYLCEKKFAGEGEQIKEYAIAVDVFGRRESFDQDIDSIVRVQANRLRKRLAEYYNTEGAGHRLHLSIPIGQYVPAFEEVRPAQPAVQTAGAPLRRSTTAKAAWWVAVSIALVCLVGVVTFVHRDRTRPSSVTPSSSPPPARLESPVGLPVGNEIRLLAGATRGYVDRSGKQWNADAYFTAGTPVVSRVQHIWRTLDPGIYRDSRQGDFSYDIPLQPGTYELRLHFAETYYGPEDAAGGGEGSRIMKVTANGKVLLDDFDVVSDAAGGRTADVKVFTDIHPAEDGRLHLSFASLRGGRAMVSAMELLPGLSGRIRPVRIVARDVPYYSDDSRWWSSDLYFKGGQLSGTEEPAVGTDDPELYATERWGHFSYAIPVTPGRYMVTLYFIERRLHAADHGQTLDSGGPSTPRVFNVFCNRRLVLREVNILAEAGENRPLVRKITGLEPDAQGKLLLEFVPVSYYATLTAIEVVPQ
ncbi:MAG TPA: malectin domain-containing carbohydrate-binding protein [Terriglobales bacterium]|nr:malectin domain-containing carbohydrate-binding protein [Terriglobales bacterium]